MAMTPAERQAAYRQRRASSGGNGERRLSAWIKTGALLDLRRLAYWQETTIGRVIERLVAAEVERLVATLSDEAFDRFLRAPSDARRGALRRNVTRTDGERKENGATEP
jgi:hypothetical protein